MGKTEREAVSFPSIGQNDRDYVHLSFRLAGHHRGMFDGRQAMDTWAGKYPPDTPVPAKHLKLHASAAARSLSVSVSGASSSAKALRARWLEGYEEGYKLALSLSLRGPAFMQAPSQYDGG